MVRLSALHTGFLYPQEIFLVLVSVRVCFEFRAIVRPKGLCQWRMTPATFRLISQCLNRLRHRLLSLSTCSIENLKCEPKVPLHLCKKGATWFCKSVVQYLKLSRRLVWLLWSTNCVVNIATVIRLPVCLSVVRISAGARVFHFTNGPVWLWGQPNLLLNGYRDCFPGGKAAWAWGWSLTSV
jgi:hypothetical protein